MVSDMAIKGVLFRWVGQPIKAPSGSVGHPNGGRLRHYGTVEIVEAEGEAEMEDAVSISLDDIVEVLALDGGKENSGTLGNEGNDSSPHQPFLAQVEALWEDIFTGVPYCRARWLLRASDLPGDISGNEVLLTTAADTFGVTYILGLAQIGSPAVLGVEQPHSESDCEAMRSCRAGTPKGDEKGRGKATLTLTRGFDPFSEGRQFVCLPDDHPALSRLRHRAQVGAAAVSGGNGDARGISEHSQHKRRSSRRSGWRFAVRELGADVRDGVHRKSLRSVRLAERGEMKARDEGNASSSCSIQHSSDISSSDVSDESYREKDDDSSPDDDGQPKDEPRAGKAVRCHHPMVRRKRQARQSSIASDVRQHRPKRLAMPPSHPSGKVIPTTRSSRIDDVNSSNSIRLVEPVSMNSERSKSSLLGGKVARDIQVKGESEGEERPAHGAFPHRPASVGREYQADIPDLLSAEEQKAYHEEVDRGGKGGEQVWASVRNWKDEDKSCLEEYLQEARCSMEERRFAPGVPVAISIGNSKDKRRKKKMAWAVMSTKVSDSKKASVKCSGNESLEVSRDTIQCFQVEEMAFHAWMQEKNFDDFGPALRALHSQTDDSGPLATWTNEQIGSLLEALERGFGQDRYHRSRGQDRHREHTNLASLSTSVAGKTPSQVLSFYYRYMATGDPISYLLGTSEKVKVVLYGIELRSCSKRKTDQMSSRKLREKRIIRPRTPPSPSSSPSPTLKQQQQQRQQQQHVSDRDTNTVAGKIKEADVASEGVKMESGCRERDAAPRGDTSEQLRSSLGSGREAYPSGAMGAGVIESLPQRGTLDERGRGMQRPRHMKGTLRSAIPADAIIVEVSDDEESSMQSRSYHTGNDNKVEVDNDGVGGRGGGDRGAKAVRFSEPASGGFAVHGPGYEGRTTDKGNDSYDSFHHPRPINPAYMGPRYPDRRYSDRRYADPQYPDQRYVDQRQYSDHRYNADSRNFDPVYAGSRYAGQSYPDLRYQDDTRYSADQGITDDPRLTSNHVMHSVDHGNPSRGVNSLENGLYPMQTGERCDIDRSRVGYGRVARMHSSEGTVQGHGRGRCVDGGIEMAHCWQLLEWAKLSGLEEDRVQYLEGLLQVHERRPMTYNMLVERLESALSDRPSILDNFIRLFAQMEIPDPRHHPYSASRSRAPFDYNNIDEVQSVSPRSNSGRDRRFPPQISRGPHHDSAMERCPYDSRGMKRRSGHGQHDFLITDRRSPPPILGSPRANDVLADIPMRGSSTPAMLLLPPPPPLPETYPESLPYTTRDFSSSGAARGMASAYHSGEVVSTSKVATELASGVGNDASMMPRLYRRHGYRENTISSSVLAAPDAAAGGSKPSPVVGGISSIERGNFGRNWNSDAKEANRSHYDRVDMLRPS